MDYWSLFILFTANVAPCSCLVIIFETQKYNFVHFVGLSESLPVTPGSETITTNLVFSKYLVFI